MIHINGAVAEIADFLAVVGTEYKSGTNEKFFTINVLKRRRIDASEAEFAKFTYLAHPFNRGGWRLIDDLNLDKVLSLQSLATDIDVAAIKGDKVNATQRLKIVEAKDFDENY